MKRILTLIGLSIALVNSSLAQLIDATPETQTVCGGSAATLTATVFPPGSGSTPGSLPTTSYAITTIPYAPDPLTAGTSVFLTDDSQTGLIPIGFTFCYYGNSYTNCVIGSNNWLGFQLGETSTWITQPIPNPALGVTPRNTIMGPWQDINPGVGGTVKYAVYGVAPFRRFSVSWDVVPMFSCTGQLYSSQIIIYESTNIIETHILNKSLCPGWNSGNAVHGLQNATGTLATVVPGRNNTQWTASNEGTRFTPNGTATYTINWYILPANTLIATQSFTMPPDVPPFVSTISVTPPTSPQFYYAEVVGPNGCGTIAAPNTDTVVVLSSSLAVDAGAYQTICQGSVATLTANAPGAISYSWFPGGGSTAAINVSPAATTVYTVNVIDGVGCMGSDTVSVGVNPAPFADAGFGAAICPGDNIMLSGTGSGTYAWTPAASLDNATIASPTATPAATTTYTMTITNGIGCSASDTATVFVTNVPADAGAYTNLCLGASTNLTASGGTTYSWTPTTGLSNPNIANPVATPLTTTTYSVLVTDLNGCSKSDTVTIAVHTLPVADAGAFSSICSGFNTTLGASGGTNYAWSPTTGLSSSTIFNPVASPTTTTTYSVIVTDAFGCVSNDTVTVAVHTLPAVDAGADVSICMGSSTTLNASGAINYLWTPSSFLSNPTIFNPVANPPSLTTYTVVGTNAYGCSASDTVRIDLNGINITISSPATICNGANTTLTSTGAATYLWSPSASLTSSTIANPVASPTATTTYTVIGTAGTGCADTAFVTITVNPLPIVNAGPTAYVCNGSSTTLAGSGGSSYLWSPGTSLSNVNIANPVANPTTTITYTLTGSDLSGCSATDTVTVFVKPVPLANAGFNTSICNGTSTTLNGTGGGTYAWSPAGSLSNSTIANPIATPTTTTSYTVTVTGTNGCTATSLVIVTVNPSPIAVATPVAPICLGASTVLNASGGGTYAWSPATGLSNTTISNPTANPTTTTTYIVTVSNGTCTDTASVIVLVNSTMAMGAATVIPETCGDFDGSITAGAVTGGGAPFMYSLNGGTPQSSPTFTNLTQGTYIITVVDASGCSATSTVIVNQIIGVNASFTGDPAGGVSPLTVNFTNNSTGASGYMWDFGDGNFSTATNPSNIYVANGTYTVTLIAYNGSAICADTTTFTIDVYDNVVMIIPNVFTPNGDLENEIFSIQTQGIKTLKGTIYNRWGKKISEWEGIGANDGWNGKINGKTADDGTYYYIIQAVGQDKKDYEEKGFVQLIAK